MKVMYIYIYIKQNVYFICRQATCDVSYCGSLCVCGYLECNQQKLNKCILEM